MGKMDRAARRAERAAQRDLPDRPHHLCIDPRRKYPPPPGFWFSGPSARLQYMTYLSDADRGFLLTLPFFEIRDEPDTPTPSKMVVAARGEAKKKMSFKDYQNMKKSASPADPDLAVKATRHQNGRAVEPSATATHAATTLKEARRREEPEPRPGRERSSETTRLEKPRKEADSGMDLPPPRTVPARNGEVHGTAESRKRKPDWQDDTITATTAAQKKIKMQGGEASSSNHDSNTSRPPEKEASNNSLPSTASERNAQREPKTQSSAPVPPHATANGQTRKGRVERGGRLLSPPAAGAQVNGTRAQRSGSTTPTPPKVETAAKKPVPDLLSPLRLGFDEDTEPSPRTAAARKSKEVDQRGKGHSRTNSGARVPALLSPLRLELDEERRNIASSKKPAEREKAGDRGSRGAKAEETAPGGKPKPPTRIPPLLSPTLPPVVEAELTRLKKSPSEGDLSEEEEYRSSESPPPAAAKTKAPTNTKAPADNGGGGAGAGTGTGEKRRSKIVVLKYKKRSARTVAAILALPSKSHKEALKKDNSRPLSRERTTPPPRARKRPPPVDEQMHEPPKRAKPGVPSTPLKNAATAAATTTTTTTSTAMSRAASNNSQAQAQTPSHSTGLTPVVAADRPQTSSGSLDPAKAATYRQRHMEHLALGSKLKHARDDVIRHGGHGGGAAAAAAQDKRVGALSLEMILAYMVSFSALNLARLHENKVLDLQTWETLLPHFGELVRRRPSRPLRALALQMNAICLEEITRAYTSLDPAAATASHSRWVKMEKKRPRIWADAAGLLDEIPDDRMKANLGPWTPVEAAVPAALAIMREWADRERVPWKTEISFPSTAGR